MERGNVNPWGWQDGFGWLRHTVNGPPSALSHLIIPHFVRSFEVPRSPSGASLAPMHPNLRLVTFAVALAGSGISLRCQTGNIDVTPVIVDADFWRTHPPGAFFAVNVSVQGDPLQGSLVNCQWVDEHRQPLGPLIPVSNTPIAIQSPSTGPGFYGLVFTSPNPLMAFLPQPRGFPSPVYGFAVLPPPPSGLPEPDETQPFGMVHGNREDPYLWSGSGPRVLGIHLKTRTWSHTPTAWTTAMRQRMIGGHTEMPLVSNSPWDSIDTQPIGNAQLDQIATKFSTLLRYEPSHVEYWQVGREENGGGNPYAQSHYFSNLLAKISRLRTEADAINPDVKFVYSTRGEDMGEFQQLFASQAFALYYDGLAQDPYKWPDFPTPESWLPSHISDIRTRMVSAGLTNHFLWFGECGIPVRGTNDPQAFFGYPSSQTAIPGATLDYAARYMVKLHVLALAHGITRIYWYNYQNRAGSVDYAEDHFGLRTYSSVSNDPGHPLPSYVAYITMLSHLKGCRIVDLRAVSNVYVFEFAVNGTQERRILAWVDQAQSVTLPLSSVQPGLVAASVQTVTDMYGRPLSAINGQNITLDDRLVYLRF